MSGNKRIQFLSKQREEAQQTTTHEEQNDTEHETASHIIVLCDYCFFFSPTEAVVTQSSFLSFALVLVVQGRRRVDCSISSSDIQMSLLCRLCKRMVCATHCEESIDV